ncbi:PAAR domain-containing protein [Cupriavidus sp. LEh25]|nr:PAAR domain-containing protein [Cupriavidus sp. LEh25]
MSDMRYALRNGDKTSTGGKLIATGQSLFHHDRAVGIEGDHATCPACKAGGPVMNDCHPDFDIGGKQILVSGARVYCKCSIHPTVIHSQSSFTVQVNRKMGKPRSQYLRRRRT